MQEWPQYEEKFWVYANLVLHAGAASFYARAAEAGVDSVLIADVPLGTADSLYVKLGDWVGWLSLAGFVFFIVFTPVIKRRTQAQETEYKEVK